MELDCSRDRWLTAVAFGGAVVSLGYALQVSNGTLHPAALAWLTVAFTLCIAGIVLPTHPKLESLRDTPTMLVLGAGLAFQFALLLTTPPGIYLQLHDSRADILFFSGLALAAVLCGASLVRVRWLGPALPLVLLLTHFLLGVWLIKSSPHPFIDVYIFQRDAIRAFLSGQNPYAITYPDIYGNSPFYGPGLSVGGRLTFGFPYPPLSLLLAFPGHLLGGDYRYSQLCALTLSGTFMTYARPGRVGLVAAATFLFTPRVFFVLEQGWTEPFVVLLLSAVVFCACRAPRLLPYALGLFFVVKQYLVFAIPVGLLFFPKPFRWREVRGIVLRTTTVALAVSLPLIAWNVSAFVRDVVTIHIHQPFRQDSLSYLAWLARYGGAHPPTALAFAAALAGVALGLWRAARSPAGFAATVALVYLGFFAFNKQAFCNYYFFVLGALCCAIAASGNEPQAPATTSATLGMPAYKPVSS